MLDRMKNPPEMLSDRSIPMAQFVSEKIDIADRALEKYDTWQK
jgi:hypothetical protein